MQDIETRLLFFELKSCGWYQKQTHRISHAPADAFGELKNWVDSCETIEATQLFETENIESEVDPIYVYDIQKSNKGNFLLTLWVGTQTDENNQVLAINKYAIPGHISNKQIKSQSFGDDFLPGYPHYFWIIPEKNLVISLFFGAIHSGFTRLRTYMKTFIQDCTVPPEDTRKKLKNLPRFGGHRVKVPSNIAMLKERRNFITQLVLKKNLKMSIKTERGILIKLLDLVADASGKIIDKNTVHVETKLNITPTEELFDEIIEHWYEMPEDKVGFKFSDEEGITYLDRTLIKGIATLENISDNEAGILDAKSLLAALDHQQERILNEAKL